MPPRGRGARGTSTTTTRGRRRSARISSREGTAAESARGGAYIDETQGSFDLSAGAPGPMAAGDQNAPPGVAVAFDFGGAPNAAGPARIDSDDEAENAGPAVKRPKIEEEAKFSGMSFMNDEGDCCTICFSEYEASGEHRLVCLKCGHLFGKSCIERWLKIEKNNKCPTCKATAKPADIRAIFGKLSSGDNTEMFNLKLQLKSERTEKEQLQIRLATVEQKLLSTEEKLQMTEREFETFRALHTPVIFVPKSKVQILSAASVMISPSAMAKGLSFSQAGVFLVAGCEIPGKPSGFSHGFYQLSLVGGKPGGGNRFTAHSQQVRQVRACPFNERLVASIGDDQMLIIRDVTQPKINVPQQKFKLPNHPFCLAWLSEVDLVVGLKNGRVLKYSRTSPEFEDLTDGEGTTSIMSLHYDPDHRTLFICTPRQISAYRQGRMIKLVDSGRFAGVHYDPEICCFLVTIPPNTTTNEPMMLRLFKVEFGTPLTVRQIGEHKTKSMRQERPVTSVLWKTPAEEVHCAYYDETRTTTVILNWGQRDKKADADPREGAQMSFSWKQKDDDAFILELVYLTRERKTAAGSEIVHQLAMLTRNKLLLFVVKYE
ncbi:hypothetical protein M3Y99_00929500 [Aphelenchoides fujianensis]|nr:hypothetical protein M3Y99_00929500 [Aphelenchoides fujianensis]